MRATEKEVLAPITTLPSMSEMDRVEYAFKTLIGLTDLATLGPWWVQEQNTKCDVRGLPINTTYDYRGDAISSGGGGWGAVSDNNASYIATMGPNVGYALAHWLETIHSLEVEGEGMGVTHMEWNAAVDVADQIIGYDGRKSLA